MSHFPKVRIETPGTIRLVSFLLRFHPLHLSVFYTARGSPNSLAFIWFCLKFSKTIGSVVEHGHSNPCNPHENDGSSSSSGTAMEGHHGVLNGHQRR